MKGGPIKYFKLKWGRRRQESLMSSINSGIAEENDHLSAGTPAGESTTQQIPMDDPLTSSNAVIAAAGFPGSVASIQHGGLFQAGTMFPYAHSCTFNNPLFVDMQTPSGSEALKWLQAHSMTGVEHNSSARAPPPKCCVGTRSGMILEIHDLLRRPGPKQRLLWINGPVGVGKTTIVQTLAESEARDARLGATLFFPPSPTAEHSQMVITTPTTRSDDSRVWTTISYRLATKDASYLTYVKQQIDNDPKLVEQSMEQQFETLIAEPQSSHSLSVWLDGLEQCCWKNSQSQERILRLIIAFIQEYPSSPLVWIITSRPERHLVRIFEKYIHLRDHIKELRILVDSDGSRKDVRLFLGRSFNDIQKEFDITQPLPWPEQNDFNVILLAVSGLFLFASAIIQFVGDREIGDPKTRFDSALLVASSQPLDNVPQENPLVPVHRMYTEVLRSMHPNHYPITKRILGFFLLPSGFGDWTQDSTSFWALCNILGIRENVAYSCLGKLYSLVEIPKREDAATMPARFYHNSFAHYLANREYSKKFWIDTKEVVADLWQCHFRALQKAQVEGSSAPNLSMIGLAWSSTSSDIETFRRNIWENARRVFFHHLLPCPSHHCGFGLHYDALSNTDNPPELIEVFRRIQFHNLVDGYVFPDVPYRFLAFLDWVVGEGQAPLQRGGILQTFDVVDPEYAWIDRNATSFKIQDTHLVDGGHIVTFEAYTDRDLVQSTVRVFTTSTYPDGTLTRLGWVERVGLIRVDSSQLGTRQGRSLSC